MTYEPSESRFDPPRDDRGGDWRSYGRDEPSPASQEKPRSEPHPTPEPGAARPVGGGSVAWSASSVRVYTMLMHLALPVGMLISGGLLTVLAPVIMWVIKKDDEPEIDRHGREVVNAMISLFGVNVLLGVASILLLPVGGPCITIPLFAIVNIGAFVLGIVGAIDANEGRLRRYPFTMRLL